MFDFQGYKLKQWTVTTSKGSITTIAVSNLDSSSGRIPPVV